MSYRVVVRPEARTDLLATVGWYEQQQAGLGVDFSVLTETAIDSLGDNPFLHQVRARRRSVEVRWLFPERFPYRIIYFVAGQTVTVFAVLHAKRHDVVWQRRV